MLLLGALVGFLAASTVARIRKRRESTIVVYLTPFTATSVETRRTDAARLVQELVN